ASLLELQQLMFHFVAGTFHLAQDLSFSVRVVVEITLTFSKRPPEKQKASTGRASASVSSFVAAKCRCGQPSCRNATSPLGPVCTESDRRTPRAALRSNQRRSVAAALPRRD